MTVSTVMRSFYIDVRIPNPDNINGCFRHAGTPRSHHPITEPGLRFEYHAISQDGLSGAGAPSYLPAWGEPI
jgi:hypothetical protein